MSTSENRNLRRVRNIYLISTAFLAVFATVYELFAHGVISFWMIGMPLFPLILGALPCHLLDKKGGASDWALQLWNCGVITLTVGSLLNGIFEIFGTYFEFFPYFLICGIALLVLGVAVWFLSKPNK